MDGLIARRVRYVSLFSGVEAATLAWEPLGWEPMAFCEVDPFPCAVLAHRYPDVPNLGDVKEVDWREFADSNGRPDVVVGGSPCQSFSIAGDRTGLEGASGLMWEYVRAVQELRPRCLVWENVPGALSSTHGEDFRCLLSSLDDLGYGLAWRVLDAQFFGVAQRRRRLFVVGFPGDGGAERACEVLFERACVPWDPRPSREKRAELAARAGGRAALSGVCVRGDVAEGAHMGLSGLGASDDGSAYTPNTMDVHAVVGFCQHSSGNTAHSAADTSPPITSSMPPTGVAAFKYHQGSGAGSIGYGVEQPPTLTADCHTPAVLIGGDVTCGPTR